MDLSFLDKLFIRQYKIELRFLQETSFHFFHGPKIYGFTSRVLKSHPLGDDIILFLPESGRVYYKYRDSYNFGLSILCEKSYVKDDLQNLFSDFSHSNYPGDLNHHTVEFIGVSEFETPQYSGLYVNDNTYTLHFISPLRMERCDSDKEEGKTYFDINYFDCVEFFYRLFDRLLKIHKLNIRDYPLRVFPELPKFELLETNFMWIDAPKEKGTLGGIIGSVKFQADLDEVWKKVLWLGQFTHAGLNTSFGFGKYFIEDNLDEKYILKPNRSFLDTILQKDNFETAFYHIKANSDLPGVDGIPPEFYEISPDEKIENIIDEIKSGSYESKNLKGIIIPKKDSKIRALAVPTVKDRIFQRATTQVLGESIDHLLEENSFAYRKGFSRISAAKAINNAYKNGFKFLLESDIQSFFDNVDWQILFNKIDILFRNDPVVPYLKEWVMQNVEYQGKTIKRNKGLPQGAVISPLLANLYLDEFDEALQDDFKLIRYADDFVILCKSKEQAEEALNSAVQVLKKLELEIKPSKTKITSFNEGFQYLGYLFMNSLILEKEKITVEQPTKIVELEESIAKDSWLSLVDLSNLKPAKRAIPFQPIISTEVIEPVYEKFPVYITDFTTLVNLDADKLEIIDENRFENDNQKIPIHEISALIIIGASKITMPAILKLVDNNIPVFICRANGEVRLSIPAVSISYSVWLNQASLASHNEFCLNFSKVVVEAKINNQKVMARRLNKKYNIEKFDKLINKIEFVDTIESLRGIEGSAAILFFEALNDTLSEEWKFEVRSKHPPRDPINAMLSFGYTILYHYISTALQVEGLNPSIGWFHKQSDRYFPLAADIQEEFRHLIDSLVAYLIHRKMVSLKDFVINGNSEYPCLMTKEFRRHFIMHVEEKLKTLFTPEGSTKKITYRDYISIQAKSIKKISSTGQMNYNPLRIR